MRFSSKFFFRLGSSFRILRQVLLLGLRVIRLSAWATFGRLIWHFLARWILWTIIKLWSIVRRGSHDGFFGVITICRCLTHFRGGSTRSRLLFGMRTRWGIPDSGSLGLPSIIILCHSLFFGFIRSKPYSATQ